MNELDKLKLALGEAYLMKVKAKQWAKRARATLGNRIMESKYSDLAETYQEKIEEIILDIDYIVLNPELPKPSLKHFETDGTNVSINHISSGAGNEK